MSPTCFTGSFVAPHFPSVGGQSSKDDSGLIDTWRREFLDNYCLSKVIPRKTMLNVSLYYVELPLGSIFTRTI